MCTNEIQKHLVLVEGLKPNMNLNNSKIPSVLVALFASNRICSILEVEKTLSSGANCLAPALRFLLLQLCKIFKI